MDKEQTKEDPKVENEASTQENETKNEEKRSTEKKTGDFVPRTRLNEEINKRKEYETQLNELSSEIQALKDRDLTEQERVVKSYERTIDELQAQVSEYESTVGELKSKYEDAEFNLKVYTLANDNEIGKFKHPDYLGMLVKREGLDVADNETVGTFLKGLSDKMPEMFVSPVKGGAGQTESKGGSSDSEFFNKKISDMNEQEKVAFAKKVGKDAYQKQLISELRG